MGGGGVRGGGGTRRGLVVRRGGSVGQWVGGGGRRVGGRGRGRLGVWGWPAQRRGEATLNLYGLWCRGGEGGVGHGRGGGRGGGRGRFGVVEEKWLGGGRDEWAVFGSSGFFYC